MDADHGAVVGPDPLDSWRAEFDLSTTGITLVSTDGRLLRVNAALCRLLGRSETDLTSLSFPAVTHPEDVLADQQLFAEVNRGEREGYRLTKRYLRPDSTVVWADLTVTAVRAADGSPAHYVSQVVDVTEQRRGRRRLDSLAADLTARARSLERSNDDLHAFAAAVSHDLQNPLTALRGYLSLLADHEEGWTPDQRTMLVGRASGAAAQMGDLIGALLEFATVDPDPPTTEVDLTAIVERSVASHTEAVTALGGRIDLEAGEAWMTGSGPLLLTLVDNLLGNALKHARADTPPVLRVRTAHTVDRGAPTARGQHESASSARSSAPAAVELVVADNGPGIREEELSRVTAMFARGADTVTRGYGIGLSTCRRIVAGHGGRLQLEKAPEGGLLVRCLFPARSD